MFLKFIYYHKNKYNYFDTNTTHLKIRLCMTGRSRAKAVGWQPKSSSKMQVNLYGGIN